MKKKVLSVLLALAVTLTMMPGMAFAGEISKKGLGTSLSLKGTYAQEQGEYTIKIVNDSAAPGQYKITINSYPWTVLIPGTDEAAGTFTLPEGLIAEANDNELTIKLNAGDTYSVQLLSRPDYYSIESGTVKAEYKAGDAVSQITETKTYTAGQGEESLDEDVFVTILRDANGDKLISRNSLKGDNALSNADNGKYVVVDDKPVADGGNLLDCKTIAGTTNNNWPLSWNSYTEGNAFFVSNDMHLHVLTKGGSGASSYIKDVLWHSGFKEGDYKAQLTKDATINGISVKTFNWQSGTSDAVKAANRATLDANVDSYIDDLRPKEAANKICVEKNIEYQSSGAFKTSYLNNHSLYVYQLVEKADIKTTLPAAQEMTYTFSADATKNECDDFTFKLLNKERFEGLTEILSDELIAQLLANKADIQGVDIESIDSVASLLDKEYIDKLGRLVKSDNMPLDGAIHLQEIDRGDGFYEGLEYDLQLAGPEFLTINPDYLVQQSVLSGVSFDELLSTIKLLVGVIMEDNEDLSRTLYIIEKNLLEEGLVIPVSIGGRYTCDRPIRAGIYKMEIENPAKGWNASCNEMYIKLGEDGSATQVTANGEPVEQSAFVSESAIQLNLAGIMSALAGDVAFNPELLTALFNGSNPFLTQETGVWVQHNKAEVIFNTGEYGTITPGAKYLLINRTQLLDMVNSLLQIGKTSVDAVKDGIGYASLKDLKQIITNFKEGQISTEQIKEILITAIANSDKLEGVNIPTMLEAVADENGVVRFNEDCSAAVGKITSFASGTYKKVDEELKAVTAMSERINNSVTEVKERVSKAIARISGLFGKLLRNNEAKVLSGGNPSKDLNTVKLAAVLQDDNEFSSTATDIIGKMGDAKLVNGLLDFAQWLNSIQSPELKIGSQSGTINQGKSGKATFEISSKDYDPQTYNFAWDTASGNAPQGLSASIIDEVITITATDEAVKGEYDFKVWATYDGLKLTASATVKIKGPATPSEPQAISIGEQNGEISAGQAGSVYFEITEKGLDKTTYEFEWADEVPAGLTARVEDGKLFIDATEEAVKGEYDFKLTARDGTYTVSDTDTVEVLPEQLSAIEKIMTIVNKLGNNSLGYSALNLVGLQDGTLPEGDYILIQTEAPAGFRTFKGTYDVELCWDEETGEYAVSITQSKLAELSQRYNTFAYKVDAVMQKVKKVTKKVQQISELSYLILRDLI